MSADAWVQEDPTVCPTCGLEACEDHLIKVPTPAGLDESYLLDATVVAADGQEIAAAGVPYLVKDPVPAYGMLGALGDTHLLEALEDRVRRRRLSRPHPA